MIFDLLFMMNLSHDSLLQTILRGFEKKTVDPHYPYTLIKCFNDRPYTQIEIFHDHVQCVLHR